MGDFLYQYAEEVSKRLQNELPPETIYKAFLNIVERQVGTISGDFATMMEAEMTIVGIISSIRTDDLKDFIIKNLQ